MKMDYQKRPIRDYWNEPTMGWWERLYLFEVIRGLHITGKIFVGNMWKWLTFRKGALTAYYPEEVRGDYSPNNRGRHVLVHRDDASPQCVTCNMCATVCPAYAIEILSEADFDNEHHPKVPKQFEIDYTRCIFCGFCVESCPEDAIRMDKETPDFPDFNRDKMRVNKEQLLSWRPTGNSAKKYPASVAFKGGRP